MPEVRFRGRKGGPSFIRQCATVVRTREDELIRLGVPAGVVVPMLYLREQLLLFHSFCSTDGAVSASPHCRSGSSLGINDKAIPARCGRWLLHRGKVRPHGKTR